VLLRQLRYFGAVASEGSVVAAARRLRVAQPALSRQMKGLERDVGVALLAREPRGTRLTPAGTVLAAAVGPLLEGLHAAARRVRLADAGQLGHVRIALSRGAADSSVVVAALAAVRRQYPEVTVTLSESQRVSQLEELRAGEIDVGLTVSEIDEPDLESTVIHEYPIDGVVVAEGHPLSAYASLDIRQLRGERLLTVDQKVFPFPRLFRLLKRLGVEGWETHTSAEAVYSLVAAGRGWTFGSSSLNQAPPPGTVVRPLTGLKIGTRMVARTLRAAESSLPEQVVAFLAHAAGQEPGAALSEETRPVDSVLAGLEFRHLRALLTTLDSGSVSVAAQRLGMTQSGLSRQLRALEREMGVPLLHRRASGVKATEAGQALSADAVHLLALADKAVERARQMGSSGSDQCRLGVIGTEFSGELVVRVLKDLGVREPQIEVEVSELLTPHQITALKEGRIDVGVAGATFGPLDDPEIESALLVEDVIDAALIREGHPLAAHQTIRPEELAKYPFLAMDRSTYPRFYDLVMQRLGALGLEPKMIGAVNAPRMLWRATADSDGWTLWSRLMRSRPPEGMVAIPIEGLSIPSGVQLLWRSDEMRPVVLAVLDAFRRNRMGQAQ
jgi:DNA-binding transcriptional LysR family regulator